MTKRELVFLAVAITMAGSTGVLLALWLDWWGLAIAGPLSLGIGYGMAELEERTSHA